MVVGTKTLAKLILRRDRVKLPIWVISIVGLLVAMIPLLSNIYGDEESLQALYATFGASPAGLFLTGPLDAPTLGGLMTIETLLWWGLAVAFMNTFLIVRHTRHNEEIGAQELILSGQAHRASGLASAMSVAVIVNATLTIGMGLGLSVFGSSFWTAENAWLYACAMGLFGLVWATVASIVVQLVEGARSANGILAATIGATFLLRGIGDFTSKINENGLSEPSWWSWLSPFGWMQATRPLTSPQWWPLIVSIIFIVLGSCLAFALLVRRDVGRGILPTRKGKIRASKSLKKPLGLTWYLQKNIFAGWLIGALTMAITIGVLVPEMSGMYESNESMKTMIEAMGGAGAMIPAFLSAMLSIIALMVMAYAVHGLGKLRSEERGGFLENVLATRLSRLSWLGMHTGVVFICSAVMLAASGAVLAICVNFGSVDYTANIWEYAVSGLSYMPVITLFGSAYILLFGILPRAAGLIVWLYYGFVVFMTWLGPLLKLDQFIVSMSVMEHITAPPAEPINTASVIIVLSIALVAIACGSLGWRHRNLLER